MSGALDPLDPRTLAYADAPDTSREAVPAAHLRAESRRRALACLVAHEDTADGVARRLRLDVSQVSPRLVELRRLGFVRFTGERRLTRFGKPATVCQATIAGRLALIQAARANPREGE